MLGPIPHTDRRTIVKGDFEEDDLYANGDYGL